MDLNQHLLETNNNNNNQSIDLKDGKRDSKVSDFDYNNSIPKSRLAKNILSCLVDSPMHFTLKKAKQTMETEVGTK